LKVYSIDD